MTLPFPPYNPSAPIPNGTFSSINDYFLQGASGPVIVGAGIEVNASGVISATGTGSNGTVTSITTGAGLVGGTITTTGLISLDNSGVTPGSYAYPALSVDSFGRITSISSGNPVVGLYANAPLSLSGTPTSPVLSVGLASTTGFGVTRLTNSTVSTLTNEALTAAGGNSLQIQIDALAKSLGGLNLAGTFDASSGNVVTATAAGNLVGITAGNPLPPFSSSVDGYYVIVTTAATSYTPPGSPAISGINVGDYILAVDGIWNILRVGPGVGPYATTTDAGSVRLATLAEAAAGVDPNAVLTPQTGSANYLPKSVVTAPGQLLVGDSPSSLATISLGTTGQVLVVDPATPYGIKWATLGGGGTPISSITFNAPLTSTTNPLTSGSAVVSVDAATVTSTGVVQLATPADAIAGTSTALAVTPAAGAAAYVTKSSFTGAGELVVGTSAGAYSALPPGSDGQTLVVCSACTGGLTWITGAAAPVAATPSALGLVYGCQTASYTSYGYCAYQDLNPLAATDVTAFGSFAGEKLYGGTTKYNVLIGNYAAGCAQAGYENTAVGHEVFGNTNVTNLGDGNTAVGYRAGFCACLTANNTLIGTYAGCGLGAATGNTLLGACAGKLVAGNNNVIITSSGNDGTNGATFTGTNSVVIGGDNAKPSSSSAVDEVSIWAGPTVSRFDGGTGAWAHSSDARLKDKIENLDLGLDLVDKLQPRKFVWKSTQLPAAGFVAQEVDVVLGEFDYGHCLGVIDKKDPEHYLVSSEALVPVLVNAIKELKSEIEELKKKVN